MPIPRAPRAVTVAVAACTLSLASAAPTLARPAGHGPARPCIGCAPASTAGAGSDGRLTQGVRTSSLAGTTEADLATTRRDIGPPDADGATTLAVIAIAGAALLAGGGAGFAGARRVGVRTG
jgi:hypothetical protein